MYLIKMNHQLLVLFYALCCSFEIYCHIADFDYSHYESFRHRKLLTESVHKKLHHNDTKDSKNATNTLKTGDPASSQAGTEAAVLIIVVIVVLSVILMIIYFIRKFDQLNRSVPSYRYSSLKSEINGVYGPDDKTESQALVNVSTEEEDCDDSDEDEDDDVSPPTLLVRSQTVTSGKNAINGSIIIPMDNTSSISKQEEPPLDSDDELLQ